MTITRIWRCRISLYVNSQFRNRPNVDVHGRRWMGVCGRFINRHYFLERHLALRETTLIERTLHSWHIAIQSLQDIFRGITPLHLYRRALAIVPISRFGDMRWTGAWCDVGVPVGACWSLKLSGYS